MLRKLFLYLLLTIAFSCEKLEDKVVKTVKNTGAKIKIKSEKIIEEKVEKHINQTIKDFTNVDDIKFDDVFELKNNQDLKTVKGKRIVLPDGSSAVFFKYKIDKEILFKQLENQPSKVHAASDQKVQKIDGKIVTSNIKLLEKFLPKEIRESPVFQTNKNNKSLEFYRLKRFPVQSTLIYDPQSGTFYHLVEIKNDN